MKTFIVLSCILAMVACHVPFDMWTRMLPALRHEEIHDEEGQYAFRYITAEDTVVSERGRLVPSDDDGEYVLEIEGQYEYIGDDRKVYVTKYKGGTDGFHVQSLL